MKWDSATQALRAGGVIVTSLKTSLLRAWPGALGALSMSMWLVGACGDDTLGPVDNSCLPGQICSPITGGDGDGDNNGGGSNVGGGDNNNNGGTGGGDNNGGGIVNPVTDDRIPCDIQKILSEKCTRCHTEGGIFGAPMDLVTYDDLTAEVPGEPGVRYPQLIKERINHENPMKRMPPVAQPALTAEELQAFNSWLDAGLPANTESCEPVNGGDGDGDGGGNNNGGGAGIGKCPDGKCEIDRTGLECYELRAHGGNKQGKFKVGVARDSYYNFSFKAPWTGPAYGIVMRPLIDNTKVIHHWLLFQQKGGTVRDGAIESSSGAHPSGELVHGWAPGGDILDFRTQPESVGFEFAEGDWFIVEYHYNSSDANALDASGVEICVQKNKPTHLAGVSWLGSDALGLSTVKTTDCVPKNNNSRPPIHLIAVSPHMHLQGKHMKGVINRKDGKKDVIIDEPFDFNNQTWYPAPFVLNPGDTITTTCEFHEPRRFGTGTNDEMCYMFTVSYPRGLLSDGLPVGKAFHGDGACLGL